MLKDALRVVKQMQADRVISKYAIGGAIGALFYLEPVLTKDIDIFVILPTVPGASILSVSEIYEYLQAQGFVVQDEYIVVNDWPVQFLPATTPLELEALDQAVRAETEGVESWVMTAEHLLAICLQTGRAKDFARIVQFMEQEVIDMAKLLPILDRHDLSQKWRVFRQRFLSE